MEYACKPWREQRKLVHCSYSSRLADRTVACVFPTCGIRRLSFYKRHAEQSTCTSRTSSLASLQGDHQRLAGVRTRGGLRIRSEAAVFSRGRSMDLANPAVLLSTRHNNVLCTDVALFRGELRVASYWEQASKASKASKHSRPRLCFSYTHR